MTPTKNAGGIDIQEDMYELLPAMGNMVKSFDSRDIAHATYVFNVIQAMDTNAKVKPFYGKLAGEYASRFAGWLGFVFINRANAVHKSQAMRQMEEGLGLWVETIPEILLKKKPTAVSAYVPPVARFLNFDILDAIGRKVLKTVYEDWTKVGTLSRTASLDQLPIVFDKSWGKYLIPADQMTYQYRQQLKDLGFSWFPARKVWFTDALDSDILRALPSAGQLQRGAPPASARPAEDLDDWFFTEWLPKNIDRFSKVFNGYGRAVGVSSQFKFTVQGKDVVVDFRRDIQGVDEALKEVKERYGKDNDRDGWLAALSSYYELLNVRGDSAMHAIDMANNLEHSHGSMMEHFPPGVRAWYPKFLDFKYTSHPLQMANTIEDEDLRTLALELLPASMRSERVVAPKLDYRTPKGIALEISSQKGKANKKKKLEEMRKFFPSEMPEVEKLLEERNLHLASAARVADQYLAKFRS